MPGFAQTLCRRPDSQARPCFEEFRNTLCSWLEYHFFFRASTEHEQGTRYLRKRSRRRGKEEGERERDWQRSGWGPTLPTGDFLPPEFHLSRKSSAVDGFRILLAHSSVSIILNQRQNFITSHRTTRVYFRYGSS